MTASRFLSSAWLLACTFASGCGSVASGDAGEAGGDTAVVTDASADAPSDGASTAELEAACRAKAKLVCPAWHACDPLGFEDDYGTEDTCVATETRECTEAAGWIGMRDYAAQARACTAAIAADAQFTCAGFYRYFHEGFPGCVVTGTLAKDASCVSSHQCASGHCAFQPSGCGTCAEPLAVGDPCVELTSICADGSACAMGYAAKTTCSTFVELGADCTRKPCHWEQACVSGKCVARPKLGEACTDVATCLPGQACSPTTSTCVALTPHAPGESCTIDPGSSFLHGCQHGYRCRGGDLTTPVGACVPAKKLGEACTGGLLEEACELGLRCVAGACAALGPSSCP